ncbi:Protease [Drechslerella dactyloides]|uniref:Protease n=1 Tax=Drechslerella dactyloides TaxID=74499 RepID=A0AAD6IT01_DREDA|nr:Protease [Drechslerella dactyloides]
MSLLRDYVNESKQSRSEESKGDQDPDEKTRWARARRDYALKSRVPNRDNDSEECRAFKYIQDVFSKVVFLNHLDTKRLLFVDVDACNVGWGRWSTMSEGTQSLRVYWTVDREVVHQEVLDVCAHASEYVRRRFDNAHKEPPSWRVGDRVMLNLTRPGTDKGYVMKHGPLPHKLAAQRIGPLEILEVVSPLALKLKIPVAWRLNGVHDVISVAHLLPCPNERDPFGRKPRYVRPGEVELEEGQDIPEDQDVSQPLYEVERIIKKQYFGRHRTPRYLVKWVGYPIEENQWIAAKHLNAPDLVKQFEAEQTTPEPAAPRRGRRRKA